METVYLQHETSDEISCLHELSGLNLMDDGYWVNDTLRSLIL